MIKARTGTELLKIAESHFFISTGSKKLDKMLFGGIRSSGVTEIHGLSGSGKTQMCFELLINAVKSDDYRAAYISTRKCFFPDRIKQILEQHRQNDQVEEYNSSDIFKKILYRQAFDCDELVFNIHYLYSYMSGNKNDKNIRLIIIDSFSTHIRDLEGWNKIRVTCELTNVLNKIAHEFNCAIVLTCDMTVRAIGINRRTNQPKFSIKPFLGDILLHIVNQSIGLEKSNGVFDVTIRKCLRGEPGKTKFIIDQRKGFTDLEDETSDSEESDDENSDSNDEFKFGDTSSPAW